MEFETLYIVYVKVSNSGYITAVDSSAFLTDTTEWIEIDSGAGRKYELAQGNYFPKHILTDWDAYRYKLVDGKPQECTPEEIEAQEIVIKSSYQPPQSPYITWEELDSAYYEGVDSL